jgi:hypothetical protein
MEDALRITRFRDGNPSDPNSSSVAIFTIMIQGILGRSLPTSPPSRIRSGAQVRASPS